MHGSTCGSGSNKKKPMGPIMCLGAMSLQIRRFCVSSQYQNQLPMKSFLPSFLGNWLKIKPSSAESLLPFIAGCMCLGMSVSSFAQTTLYIDTDCGCKYKAYATFSHDPSHQYIQELTNGQAVDIIIQEPNAHLQTLVISEAGYGQVFSESAPFPVDPDILHTVFSHNCVIPGTPPIEYVGDCQLGNDGNDHYEMKVTCKP